MTGGITLNSNGDREQVYTIKHMQNADTGQVQVIKASFSVRCMNFLSVSYKSHNMKALLIF